MSGKNKIKESKGDRLFLAINDTLLLFALLIVLYPLIYIISSSFSSPLAVSTGRVVLFPVDLSLRGYEAVFEHDAVMTGYVNTIFYTIVGTGLNIIMTVLAAYPLSIKIMPGRRFFSFLFMFTMIFSGGLIPSYLLNSRLGLVNTRAVMIVPLALNIFNVIITRTHFESQPSDLYDSSRIDGANHFTYLLRISLPLSKSILAVLLLFYAVGHWNGYFQAFLYLQNRDLFPLQIVLRDILILNSVNEIIVDPQLYAARQGMADLLKYSLIVVSSAPLMVAYPFVSRHFVRGIMIGAVKG